MADTNFLGKGAKFPFQVNRATGRIETSEGLTNIKESIYMILMTQKSERIFHDDFGSSIMSYTFMDVNATSITMMQMDLTESIMASEPRVSDVTIGVEPDLDRGCLIINVDYTVIGENTRDNLVFPFYLNMEAEGSADEEQEDL